MRFELTILGSGSALPTSNRNTTAQVLNVLERFFLIDCGEGTQLQLRKHKFAFNHIDHICISHLHGDHFFGIFGLISSMALLDRRRALHIYAPTELQGFLNTILESQYKKTPFPIEFHELNENLSLIYEDNVLTVHAFPLRHSVPVWGFLFKEKPRLRKIDSSKIIEYNISIPEINNIKDGFDLIRADMVIPNKDLTFDPLSPRSYAFITDTLIMRQYNNLLANVDVLYHEATFLHRDIHLARKTMHTTALQAAQLARDLHAGKLILGHFSPRYKSDALFAKEALSVFANTEIATDGLKIVWSIR